VGNAPPAVVLSPAHIAIAPGDPPLELVATIQNVGADVDQYSIAVEGLSPQWWSAPTSAVALFPGDSIPISITIHLPPNVGVQPGLYTFRVRAYSTVDTALGSAAEGVVEIGAPANFKVELAPRRVTAHTGKYRLTLMNAGSMPLQLGLGGRDEYSELTYTFATSQVIVPPNGRVSVPVTVKPKQPRIVGGQNRAYRFAIGAQSVQGGPIREESAELVHTSRFSIWALVMLAALALILPLTGAVLWRSFAGSSTTTPTATATLTIAQPTEPPVPSPTEAAVLPTATEPIIVQAPTETATSAIALATVTSGPEECKLWVMEHRGNRDTRVPPGLAGSVPYEHHGSTYQYKSEYISTLFVDQTGVISDVNVGRIDIFRVPYSGHEAVAGTLISPSGTRLELFNWVCAPGADNGGAVSMHITLDDEAEGNIAYSCGSNFSGVFKPEFAPLSTLNGEEARGNWILQVDRYSDDSDPGGFFNKWELDVCTTK